MKWNILFAAMITATSVLPASAQMIIEEVHIQPAIIVGDHTTTLPVVVAPLAPIAPGMGIFPPDPLYKSGIYVDGRYTGGTPASITGRIGTIPLVF